LQNFIAEVFLSDQADIEHDHKNQIDAVLGLADADDVNVAYATLRVLEDVPDATRPDVLRHLIDHWDSRSSSDEVRLPRIISSSDFDELRERYGQFVDSALQMMVRDNPSIETFYRELDALVHNPILKDEKARAFSLYWILIDRRIPYFQLEKGMRLSDEDWADLSAKLQTQRAKIRFILAGRFSQRSEEADLILRELDTLERVEQVRLLGYLLWELRETDRKLRDAGLLK